MPDHPIVLEDVKRLVVGPGEALLVQLPDSVEADQVAHTIDYIESRLPGVPVIVAVGGVDVSVITQETPV